MILNGLLINQCFLLEQRDWTKKKLWKETNLPREFSWASRCSGVQVLVQDEYITQLFQRACWARQGAWHKLDGMLRTFRLCSSLTAWKIHKKEESLSFNLAIYLREDVPLQKFLFACQFIVSLTLCLWHKEWLKTPVCVRAFLNKIRSVSLNGTVLAAVKPGVCSNCTNYYSEHLGLTMAFVWYSTAVTCNRLNLSWTIPVLPRKKIPFRLRAFTVPVQTRFLSLQICFAVAPTSFHLSAVTVCESRLLLKRKPKHLRDPRERPYVSLHTRKSIWMTWNVCLCLFWCKGVSITPPRIRNECHDQHNQSLCPSNNN